MLEGLLLQVQQVCLDVGREFESIALFKKAVRKYNIAIGRSIFFPRVDPKTHPLSYQVKTFIDQHNCAKDNKCKSADEKWVVDELEKKMRTHPALTVIEAEQFFIEEYDINVNKRNIYRCIVKARERIEGSKKAQYSLLRDYRDEILRQRRCLIQTTFQREYIYLDACKIGFLGGCRLFICMDGTFLKGYYGEQLLMKWNGLDFKEALFSRAKAMTSQEFDAVMDRVKRMNLLACEYLKRIKPCQWSRSYFSE
ncbi:hypothetical protein Ahy_B04g073286 [Arachis hypogaea]|uniref:Uncharacterized protein n=1 Tax=Arachis hypogaea TaxID=3818 RepID=A0A444ZQ19_ARAHY|nr:hypothetical protein Ahy_B04g073286 [Arachis hypogaea]